MTGAVLAIIGVGIMLAAIGWMSIIGFYPDQLPMIFVMAAVGALLAWIGQRMYQSAKRETALRQIEQRDAGTE
jgi:uncharacterized membrane protein